MNDSANTLPVSSGPATIEESEREAAEQHLGKESKIDIGLKGFFLRDFWRTREGVLQDEETYRRLKVNELKDASQSAGDDVPGDFTICDDINNIHHHYPSGGTVAETAKRKLWPWILGSVLTGGTLAGAGFALPAILDAFKEKPTQPPTFTDTDTQYFLDFGQVP